MTPCGWEGNRRSGVALAMRHRLQWFIQLRAHGLDREMSTPPTLSCGVWPIYLPSRTWLILAFEIQTKTTAGVVSRLMTDKSQSLANQRRRTWSLNMQISSSPLPRAADFVSASDQTQWPHQGNIGNSERRGTQTAPEIRESIDNSQLSVVTRKHHHQSFVRRCLFNNNNIYNF